MLVVDNLEWGLDPVVLLDVVDIEERVDLDEAVLDGAVLTVVVVLVLPLELGRVFTGERFTDDATDPPLVFLVPELVCTLLIDDALDLGRPMELTVPREVTLASEARVMTIFLTGLVLELAFERVDFRL